MKIILVLCLALSVQVCRADDRVQPDLRVSRLLESWQGALEQDLENYQISHLFRIDRTLVVPLFIYRAPFPGQSDAVEVFDFAVETFEERPVFAHLTEMLKTSGLRSLCSVLRIG